MADDKWSYSMDSNGNYACTWGDFTVRKEGRRKINSASYLYPNNRPGTTTEWIWVARHGENIIDEGDDPILLKRVCEEYEL